LFVFQASRAEVIPVSIQLPSK